MALDHMSRTFYLDACHLLDLTDLHVQVSTNSHQVLTVLLLYMGLRFQPMDIKVCPWLDQWEGSLGPDPPMDTRSILG